MTSVTDCVAKLFNQIHHEDGDPAAYKDWLREVFSRSQDIDECYKLCGDPSVCATVSTQGIALAGYRWSPPTAQVGSSRAGSVHPKNFYGRKLYFDQNWTKIDWTRCKGALVYLHGISECFLFSLLRPTALEVVKDWPNRTDVGPAELAQVEQACRNSGVFEQFKDSWAESLTNAGYVIYGIDMQGHGLSQRWRDSPCNVERFQHVCTDVIEFVTSLLHYNEFGLGGQLTKIFLGGASMGGCALTRTCQLAFNQKRFRVETNTDENVPATEIPPACIPVIAGIILFCPAISADRLKKKFPNQILLPVMQVLSRLMPKAKVAALETNTPFPFLRVLVENDPLVYSEKIPTRLASEVVLEMDKIPQELSALPQNLPVFLIQSKFDTMTDPEGSEQFIANIPCEDKEAVFLDYSWHFLAKEPGFQNTVDVAITWMDNRVN